MSSTKKAVLLKVLLLGQSNVGKTSIFQRYVRETYEEGYKATIGADFFSKEIMLDDREVIFQMWDTAGQERYRSLGQTFFRGSDACILVYDICNQESFRALSEWVKRFLKGVGMEDQDAKDTGLIFVVVGNKKDLEDNRAVDSNTAQGFCNHHGFQFYETSAKENFQVSDVFQYIGQKGVEKSDKQMQQTQFSAAGATLNIDDDLNDADETPGSACGC